MQFETKQDLRERILTLLRNQREEERLHKSLIILNKLLNLQEYQRSQTIMFYASVGGEVDTFKMMKKTLKTGKRVALPRINLNKRQLIPTLIEQLDTDLEEGPYSIKQPKTNDSKEIPIENLDMIVVPALGFDKNNQRLGRGGGYYDRFLDKVPFNVPTVGLAFDFQVFDSLPQIAHHDKAVSKVLVN